MPPKVEATYKLLQPREHCLARPDTYVGSCGKTKETIWIPCVETGRMQRREVNYSPALLKIFDEILVNAADHKSRCVSMSQIRVTMDEHTGRISVFNDGPTIPIVVHPQHHIYVIELVFGNMLSGSNFNDDEKRTSGGRNGMGVKLASIFSTWFQVECSSTTENLRYSQLWTNNMAQRHAPVLAPLPAKSSVKKDNWLKVTFQPDWSKFEMKGLAGEDIRLLFQKRVYDVAGTLRGVKVFFNNQEIKLNSFKEYVALHFPESVLSSLNSGNASSDSGMDTGTDTDTDALNSNLNSNPVVPASPKAKSTKAAPPFLYEVVQDKYRWEIAVAASPDGVFEQVSFVNNIATLKGGTHVAMITAQITAALVDHLEKRLKKKGIKENQARNHLWVFVNCLIENPTFDSQTKVRLTSKKTDFGSNPVLPARFLKKVIKQLGVVEQMATWATIRENKALSKTDGKKKSKVLIDKLDDANDAGGRYSSECTLILTEGDSAKTLAVAGIAVVGRDRYGVFPLRGKILNVRDAKTEAIAKNAEITAIKEILGLQQGKVYTDVKSLRYGRVALMTDADTDGKHICLLVATLFATFWPSLLELPGFLGTIITPIVVATRGKQQKESFFTMPQYEAWSQTRPVGEKWHIKYYKGLGTSTAADAKAYFSNMQRHWVPFQYTGILDHQRLLMVSSKDQADARKQWLNAIPENTFVDYLNLPNGLPYHEFVDKEVILFGVAANLRAIPRLLDGQKPGQRKILYAVLKKMFSTEEIKVPSLAGLVTEKLDYHHGEASLHATIVKMAQQFIGSNNLALLYASGQFGSCLMGGKDSASARYLFTRGADILPRLFPAQDLPLLKQQLVEGDPIEPEFLMPVIPVVLLNGTQGMGMGYSSETLNHNPRDLIANMKRMAANEPLVPMLPWYKGFQGTISVDPEHKHRYITRGVITKINDTTLVISALPVGVWTQPYREDVLTKLMIVNPKTQSPAWIEDIRENHTEEAVCFTILMTAENLKKAEAVGLHSLFKLQNTLSTSNMVLFNAQNKLVKYDSTLDILRDFYAVRMEFYEKRKESMLKSLQNDLQVIGDRLRFILAVVEHQLELRNVPKAELLQRLVADGYRPHPTASSPFDYLLGMPLWNLTREKIEELRKTAMELQTQYESLLQKTSVDLLHADLDALAALDQMDAEEAVKRQQTRVGLEQKQSKPRKPRAKANGKVNEKTVKGKGKQKAAPKRKASTSPGSAKPAKKIRVV